MALSGQGAVPSAGGLFNELSAATRRAFIPRLFVQLYFATPTLFYLFGGAQRSAGGLNQITVPIQGNSMVQGQFTGYGGGFNSPIVTPGIQNAQFSTAYWVVPVPLPFGESVLQASEVEISILKARMNDVYAVTMQQVGTLIFTNNTANTLLPNSFVDGFDNGATVATYGGINRSSAGNASWKGQAFTAGSGSGQSGNVGFTRKTMSNSLIIITDAAGGEAPGFVIMNPADFATLNSDFIGAENIYVTPGSERTMATPVRSSFPNLNVAGVPIYADHFCPVGSAFYVNPKYTSMYLSQDAAFEWSGFQSLVALGQIGQQGVCVLGYNIISSKPVSNAIVSGIANPSSTF